MLRLVNAPLSAHADRFDLTRFHDDIPSITVGYHLRSGRFRTGVAVEKTEAFLSGQFDIQTFPTNPNPLVNLFLLDQLSPVFGSRYHMEGHHSKQDVTAEVAVDILPKLSAGIRSTYSSRWGRTDVGYYSSRAVRDRTAALTAAGSSFMAEPYTVWRSGKYLMVAGATFDRTDAAASMDPQDADPALEIVHWCDLQSNNRQQNFFFEFARGKPGRLLRIEGRYSSLHNTFSGRISTPVLTYFMFLPVVHRATGSADGHLITRSITMTYDYSFSNGRLLLRPSATFFDANYDINARATTQLAAGLVSASYSRTMRWDNIRLASISLESEYRLTPTLRLNLHAAQLIPVDEIHDDFDRAETRAPFSGGGALQPLAPASNSHIWGGTTVGASLNWSF